MQRVSKIGLILVAALILAACAPADRTLNSVDSGSVAIVEEVVEETVDDVSEEVAEASVEESADGEAAEIAAAPILSGPTDDITLIGATGRLQFLNSYADW